MIQPVNPAQLKPTDRNRVWPPGLSAVAGSGSAEFVSTNFANTIFPPDNSCALSQPSRPFERTLLR